MEQPKIINNRIFYDDRGSFSPLSLFELGKNWKQSNVSVNPNKFTLRGLHFQTGETSQSKLIKVINGKILDFVVDLRGNIKSYNNCQFFEMKSGDELIVPRGFAHGFITLEDNTIVQYLVDNDYSPSTEGSLLWSSFSEIKSEILKIDDTFDVSKVIISEKDLVENYKF
jgi:dTDP-4-dehydrorhamnose 3,5-epimerase